MPKLPHDQWPADDPVLASFAEDLRIVASGPAPEPRPGLVAVMGQGAVPIEPHAAGRKRKMLVKTLLGGLVAKVALGAGVATASVAAAGAAGVLPEPAQQAVAKVVAATTPFTVPDRPNATTLATDEVQKTKSQAPTDTITGTDDEAGDDEGSGGTRPLNHGACVSTAAKDKSGEGNHGRTVSSVARTDCGKTDRSSTTTTVGGSTTTTVPGSTTTTLGGGSTTTTVDDALRSSGSGRGNSGSGGRGNSGNSGGGGNSGNSANSGGQGNSGRN